MRVDRPEKPPGTLIALLVDMKSQNPLHWFLFSLLGAAAGLSPACGGAGQPQGGSGGDASSAGSAPGDGGPTGGEGGENGAGGSTGGEGGENGAGGSTGGEGGENGAGDCGDGELISPRLQIQNFGPSEENNISYEGPAIIERSTTREMIVEFAIDGNVAAPGAAVRRVKMDVPGPKLMPVLPIGTQVWFSRTPVEQHSGGDTYAFSIRTAEDGVLLFGAGSETTASGLPEIIQVEGDNCLEYRSTCIDASEEGEPVVINASVTLDGVSYNLRMRTSATLESLYTSSCTLNLAGTSGVSFDIEASDFSTLVDEFEAGTLPSCVLGNGDEEPAGLVRSDGIAPFDGPVEFYGNRVDEFEPNTLFFDIPTLYSSDFEVRMRFVPDSWVSPARGTELWVSLPTEEIITGALFDAEGGTLLYASGAGIPIPLDPTVAVAMEEWFGAPVTTEKACDYPTADADGMPSTLPLWDLVIHTDPPVVAHSGTRTPLVVDGENYEVWVSTLEYGQWNESLEFSVFRNPTK